MRLLVAAVLALAVVGDGGAQTSTVQTSFASRIAALSEPDGYFDTDNLISNEASYLQVIPAIERAGLEGGAYIGVGPDQNFSYIAAARPSVAFILDVRRDNLLLHLLFKAIFSLARTRVDYLALLCGHSPPGDAETWRSKGIGALVAHVDAGAPGPDEAVAVRARVAATIRSFGVALSLADLRTLDRFHRRFISEGLDLRFQTLGRSPQPYYPTFRQLLLATDASGHERNYLSTEAAFQFVKSLESRDLVIPVVGDLGGDKAMVGIGRWLREHDERLSLFYASNVEFYLFREGRFGRFIASLTAMPRADHSLVVRSVFGGGGGSISLTQSVGELVEGVARGRYRSYYELAR